MIELHNLSNVRIIYSIKIIFNKFDESFNNELNEQKEEINNIIEDFKKVLASNKINFDSEMPKPVEKVKDKSPLMRNIEDNQEKEKKKEIVQEVKYPVSIKTISSNQNFDPIYKEIMKKNMKEMESSELGEGKQMSNSSSQNLSQRVNSLINENKDKKNKNPNNKFISKN